MAGSSSGLILARTGPHKTSALQRSCQASRKEDWTIPWWHCSAEGQSPQHLHRTPALGNTWPGSDARDTGVGASSFGRGKSRGIQTSDYLGPELLSGGSL